MYTYFKPTFTDRSLDSALMSVSSVDPAASSVGCTDSGYTCNYPRSVLVQTEAGLADWDKIPEMLVLLQCCFSVSQWNHSIYFVCCGCTDQSRTVPQERFWKDAEYGMPGRADGPRLDNTFCQVHLLTAVHSPEKIIHELNIKQKPYRQNNKGSKNKQLILLKS